MIHLCWGVSNMKRKIHYRWHLSWINLCGDGMYCKEKVDGDVKKILQRETRLRLKREAKREEKEYGD